MNGEAIEAGSVDSEAIIRELSSRVDEFIGESPFFRLWRKGAISKEMADRFLLAFDQLVASFPPLIALGISRLGEGGRVLLAKNLFEECGEGKRDRTHHAIYRRYLDTVGLDWSAATPHPPTVRWREQLRGHSLGGEPAEAVGAIAAGEFLAQPALSRIYEALEPLYQNPDIEYFTTHLQLETEHVKEVTELITVECPSEAAFAKVSRGFEAGLECWGHWFDSMARELVASPAASVGAQLHGAA